MRIFDHSRSKNLITVLDRLVGRSTHCRLNMSLVKHSQKRQVVTRASIRTDPTHWLLSPGSSKGKQAFFDRVSRIGRERLPATHRGLRVRSAILADVAEAIVVAGLGLTDVVFRNERIDNKLGSLQNKNVALRSGANSYRGADDAFYAPDISCSHRNSPRHFDSGAMVIPVSLLASMTMPTGRC